MARANQTQRTRKDLLTAASRLMKQARKPSLEEIAADALVSRATAYRYFPNVEALLAEASLDVAVPDVVDLFDTKESDPVARVQRVDDALHGVILANEAAMRLMLANSLQRGMNGADGDLPARQNRRTPLLEAALAPERKGFKAGALGTLTKALALVVGTEAMVVFKDVLRLDDAEARRVRRWAIRALVDAAKKPRT